MGANVQAGDWVLLTENPKVVLAALKRGDTDGIVPAASGSMDRFAEFMIELGIPQVMEKFPDHRKRKWIDAFLLCNIMLHKAIFRLDSFSSIGPFLFSSPAVLKTLGFNLAQITKGVYEGCAQKPFNEEAMSDFFAACSPDDFLSNQKMLAKWLLLRHPEIIEDGSLIMDCLYLGLLHHRRAQPLQEDAYPRRNNLYTTRAKRWSTCVQKSVSVGVIVLCFVRNGAGLGFSAVAFSRTEPHIREPASVA